MPKARGRSHTTLTETAATIVAILRRHPDIKMIAPGKISNTGRRGASQKYLTVVYTTSGCELIITGQGTQKVAVHTTGNPRKLIAFLQQHKQLQNYVFKTRERRPGI